MLVRFLPILCALLLTACGVFSKKSHDSKDTNDHGDGSDSSDGSGQAGSDDGQGDGSDGAVGGDGGSGDAGGQSIDFKQSLLVREPGQTATDTAALFLFKPSRGTFTVSDVKGPGFLGNAAVGKLDAETLEKLFTHLSSPLPEESRQKLLADYADATAVSFEGYDGRLCSDDQFRLEISGTVEGLNPVAIYDFKGKRGTDGNCFFYTLSLIHQYSEKK